MPKIYQYTFGGWAPPGPAGGANVLPQALLLKQGRRGEGRNAEGRGNVDPPITKNQLCPWAQQTVTVRQFTPESKLKIIK